MIERKFEYGYIPSKEECFELLNLYSTPEHVKAHCNAVGITAKVVALALKEKGLNLNEKLAEASGYLHDIARVEKEHERVGADYLKSIGLEYISEVVRYHKIHRIKENLREIKELDVLCIADRTVLENKYVGPKERMEYIKSKAVLKFGKSREIEIDNFIVKFSKFIESIEEFIGSSIESLLPVEILK